MVASNFQQLKWDMDAGHKVYTIYSILALVFVILVSLFLHICTATMQQFRHLNLQEVWLYEEITSFRS